MAVTSERLVRQRAALRVALRQGDPLAAARAWERLRVEPGALRRDEFRAGRAARAAVGRSIRDARRRAREILPAAATTPPATQPSRIRPRRVLAAAAASATVVALLVLLFPRPPAGFAPAAPPPEEVAQTDPSVTLPPTTTRGRTSASLAPVAARPTPLPVEPPPSPVTTPAPSSVPGPVAVPASSGAPGGQAGGLPGGVAGGSPGGVPGGVPGGTGTATLTPTTAPNPTPRLLPLNPPPLAPGHDRFLFRVIDSRDGRPLRGTCVVLGTLDCGPNDYQTNDNGYYWLDLIPGMATAWGFKFQSPTYLTQTLTRNYMPGMGTVNIVVSLRQR